MTSATEDTRLFMTVEVCSAFLKNPNNRCTAQDAADVVRSVHAAFRQLEAESVVEEPEVAEPVVSVRRSLASEAHIVSLIDGRPYKVLRSHLRKHGMTPQQYRERFALPADYPMVAPEYSNRRREMAKSWDLGRTRDGTQR